MKTTKQILIILYLFGILGCNNGYESDDNEILIEEVFNEYELIHYINLARNKIQYCNKDKINIPVEFITSNINLQNAAKEHAFDLIKTNTFSHLGSGKETDLSRINGNPSLFYQRIERNGYVGTAYGENIAKGYKNPKDIVDAWIKSPKHCEIIMDGNFTNVGIGTFKSGINFITVANFGGRN